MKLQKSLYVSFIGGFIALLLCSSCYRMPTDEDYCVVPTTNNPALTNEKSDGLLPRASY